VTASLVWQSYLRQDHWHLYFFQVMANQQTLNFRPDLYLDIAAVRNVKHEALACHQSQQPDAIWEVHDPMHRQRRSEAGMQYAEAYILAAGKKKGPALSLRFRQRTP
jgi:hypothetical protein